MIEQRLKERREEIGMTQTELAEKLGTYQKVVSSWEKGDTSPSLEKFAKICNVLDISADELLGIKKEKEMVTILVEVEVAKALKDALAR